MTHLPQVMIANGKSFKRLSSMAAKGFRRQNLNLLLAMLNQELLGERFISDSSERRV